ncbi:uncharacterized protein LY79DRAFT_277656 [Colletotrichum navitas]|uniref:Uncharacterized protein n=1 Tax=Colletotrichum navitas TaxID=681940 RepID=A0AAD8PWD9_9PEZI|nr:uncharacterized protein LY79DRAFT_277656 [Colletotrichum navitas]KAK1585048.1 hypothetical protein LY79DRAFT_277656 [Colletotrichum navitas]
MRSYERLIRYPSDFELAKEAHLISPFPVSARRGQQKTSQSELTYADFAAFIRSFSNVSNAEASPRWHFGQFRLSRLHCAVRIFQPSAATQRGLKNRVFYEEEFWQIRRFLKKSAATLLSVFAALSLILSAMQVVLAAKDDGGWRAFTEVSAWSAVTVIVAVAAVFVGLALVGPGFWLWQFQFGYRSWRRSHAVLREAKIRDGRGG